MYREKPPEIFREIMDVLDVITAVKIIQLKIYIKKIMPKYSDEYILEMINKMKNKKMIFEPMKGYVSLNPKISSKLLHSESFFWMYLALIDHEKLPFSKGRFPADYILVKNNKLIEVVIYDDSGSVKLNFIKRRYTNPNETTILVLVLNNDENAIPNELKPYEQHQIVSIYNNQNKPDAIPKFAISKMYPMRKPTT